MSKLIFFLITHLLFICRDVKNIFGTNGIIKNAFTASAIQGNMVI